MDPSVRSNCTDKGYPRARLSRDIEHKINTVDISRDPREKLKRSNGGGDGWISIWSGFTCRLTHVIVSFLSIFFFSWKLETFIRRKEEEYLDFRGQFRRGDRYNCNNIFSIRRRLWRIVRVGNATGRKQYRDEQIGSLEERFRRCERVVSIGNPPEGIKRKWYRFR